MQPCPICEIRIIDALPYAPRQTKMSVLAYEDSEGPDQPTYPQSEDIRCLQTIIGYYKMF